jgi:hypothetical protein
MFRASTRSNGKKKERRKTAWYVVVKNNLNVERSVVTCFKILFLHASMMAEKLHEKYQEYRLQGRKS